jgi:hypothetical protein
MAGQCRSAKGGLRPTQGLFPREQRGAADGGMVRLTDETER